MNGNHIVSLQTQWINGRNLGMYAAKICGGRSRIPWELAPPVWSSPSMKKTKSLRGRIVHLLDRKQSLERWVSSCKYLTVGGVINYRCWWVPSWVGFDLCKELLLRQGLQSDQMSMQSNHHRQNNLTRRGRAKLQGAIFI